MTVALLGVLLTAPLDVARAEETGAAELPATPAPRVKRQSRRLYPRRVYDDLSVERRCTVALTISADGRPYDLAAEACPPELVEHTLRRVRKDRWEPTGLDGGRTLVEVVYVPPADVAKLAAPDYWRRRDGGACEVRVEVASDGRVALKSAPQACDPGLADGASIPPAALMPKSPTICPVTFLLVDGAPRHVDLFRCEVPAWQVVRDLLPRWTWPATERPTPYTVQLELFAPGTGPQG